MQSQPTIPQPVQPTVPPSQQTPTKSLKFLKLSLFEIGFVLLIMVLFFGLLHFFNILRLDRTFPQLAFLPHLPSSQTFNSQTNLPPFDYDITQANTTLAAYIKKTVATEFLPPTASSSADQFIFVQNNNVFTAVWNVLPQNTASESSHAQGMLFLQERKNIPATYQVVLTANSLLSIPTNSPPSAAQLTVSKVFGNNTKETDWKCTGNYVQTCTLTAKTSDGQKKYVLTIVKDQNASQLIVVSAASCLLPTENASLVKQFLCPAQ